MARYLKDHGNQDVQIVEKNELPAYSMGLKSWELQEIITGQFIDFISMEDGINDLLMKWHSEFHAMPRKLVITGAGSRLPEIDTLLESRINVKCEMTHWALPGMKGKVPPTVYGMAQSIASSL